VSHRIGEGPCQPTPFITFQKVLKNSSWRSNKHSEKKQKMNAEQGEENVQVKTHACVNS